MADRQTTSAAADFAREKGLLLNQAPRGASQSSVGVQYGAPAGPALSSSGAPAAIGCHRGARDENDLVDRNKSCDRIYFGEICGSYAMFAKNPKAASVKVGTPHSIKYRRPGTVPGEERIGDPSTAYFLIASMISFRNDMPTAVVLTSNTIRGRFYGAGDQRGFFVAHAGTSHYFEGGFPVLKGSPLLISKVVAQYGHHTSDAIEKGWSDLGDGNYLINRGSIMHQILAENLSPQELKAVEHVMTSGKVNYEIDQETFDLCVKCHTEQVLRSNPRVDFSNMKLSIERLGGGSWTAPLRKYTGGDAVDARLLETEGKFSFCLRIEFRLPGGE
jgi:hypothetical protein